MALQAVNVYGVGSRGRELSIKLAHTVLEQMDDDPKVVFLFATPEYNLVEATKAMRVILGDVPIWGGSVRQVWNAEGMPTNGMSLTAVSGEGMSASGWWIEDEPKPNQVRQAMSDLDPDFLLVGISAMQPRLNHWLKALGEAQAPLTGGLLGADLRLGKPNLLAGQNVTNTGAAIMALKGLQVGIGVDSPWRSTGLAAEITDSRGEWLRSINSKPVAEVMEEIFKKPARRWAYTPLRDIARLYPLGFQTPRGWDLRSPIYVEADGSWRMTTPIPRGTRAYWMMADMHDALDAVKKALSDALAQIQGEPGMVLLWLDWAWFYLLTAHEAELWMMVRNQVGNDVPVVGVYTMGQITRTNADAPLSLLHNHVVAAALASKPR